MDVKALELTLEGGEFFQVGAAVVGGGVHLLQGTEETAPALVEGFVDLHFTVSRHKSVLLSSWVQQSEQDLGGHGSGIHRGDQDSASAGFGGLDAAGSVRGEHIIAQGGSAAGVGHGADARELYQGQAVPDRQHRGR